MTTWWRSPFRMFQTNLREINADLDVSRTLDYIEEFGADAWLLNVGGIISFYPSTLPFQSPNPLLHGRDLIDEAVRSAHERGIRLMGRLDFSKVTRPVAERYPQWCFVGPDGSRQEYNGLTSVCPSGEYYQDRTFDILDEVLDRYPLDGFFFNWFSFNEVDYSRTYRGVCQCMACHEAFREFGGDTLPTGPESPEYQRWRRFTALTLDDLTARIRAHIAERTPQAALILGDRADIVFHEANNAVGRELWPHRTAEAVSAARSYRPDVPVLVNSVAFLDMPYRLAGEQPEHFSQYLVQAISRGANPSAYIMGEPGDIEYRCLGPAAQIMHFHRRNAEVYTGLISAAVIGLVRPEGGSAEFRGLYSCLQQGHIPFDVVRQERLGEMAESGGLSRYELLVLPDLGPLTEAATIEAFVAAGGRVLSTGSTGFRDEEAQLPCLGASRRVAVRAGEELLRNSYVRTTEAEPPSVLPIIGAYHDVDIAAGAQMCLRLLSRAPYGPPEKCYGNIPLDQPGYVRTGSTVLIPWTVGRTYHELQLRPVREFVCDLVTGLVPAPIDTDLPEQVEVVLGHNERETVLHLINFSGAQRRTFGPPLPIRDARLTVHDVQEELRVRALLSDQRCAAERVGTDLVVSLPEIGLFEVLTLTDLS